MKRRFLLTIAMILCLNIVAMAQKPRTAMYRYQSTSDNQAYAAGQNRKTFVDSANWSQVGLVGYVHTEQVPGTTPLLEITKPISGGNKYFYTTDYQEANAVMKADGAWKISSYNNGKSCYVSPTKKPGTIPVYLYSQPTAKLNYLFIFGDKENNAFQSVAQKNGINFEKVAFYIWEKQVDTVSTEDTNAPDNSSPSAKAPTVITGPIEKAPLGTFEQNPTLDLSMRNALYIYGTATGALDATAKYVSPNGIIKVKKSDAVICNDTSCTFNLGFIVYRNSAEGDLSTVASVEAKNLPKTNMKVLFKAGATSKQIIQSYTLKIGSNLVYVSLDPEQSTPESNEKNNNLRATIVVEP